MPRSLDDLRASHPTLGFALYAFDAGKPVTLEVYSNGEIYAFKAATADEAIATAFPEDAIDATAGVNVTTPIFMDRKAATKRFLPSQITAPAQAPAPAAEPEADASIFD